MRSSEPYKREKGNIWIGRETHLANHRDCLLKLLPFLVVHDETRSLYVDLGYKGHAKGSTGQEGLKSGFLREADKPKKKLLEEPIAPPLLGTRAALTGLQATLVDSETSSFG